MEKNKRNRYTHKYKNKAHKFSSGVRDVVVLSCLPLMSVSRRRTSRCSSVPVLMTALATADTRCGGFFFRLCLARRIQPSILSLEYPPRHSRPLLSSTVCPSNLEAASNSRCHQGFLPVSLNCMPAISLVAALFLS